MRVIIKGLDDLWQVDLAQFLSYSRENLGNKYILVVIDCFSKYLWTGALKVKSANEVKDAMDDILLQGRVPKNLQTDAGKEFCNRQFKELMDKHHINHYSMYSTKKASIAERVIRTIKNKLYKAFSLRGSYKWIDILPRVTDKYNNTKHRTIKMKPCDVTTKNEQHLLSIVYSSIKMMGKHKFKVGDIVRISKYKGVFAKGYVPNWSTELFKISKLQITNPATYLLVDMNGRPIPGSFYEPELQKTKHEDVYLVERVFRRKGNKLYELSALPRTYSFVKAMLKSRELELYDSVAVHSAHGQAGDAPHVLGGQYTNLL
ncbi:hypothetical protein Trydic_g13274 [Trypoxylus dichotomus]